MTREEAIKRFQLMKKILSIPNSDAARTIEAIDMAIEALSEETSTIQEKHQLSEETSTNTPTKSTNISTNASADRPRGEWISKEELIDAINDLEVVYDGDEGRHKEHDISKLVRAIFKDIIDNLPTTTKGEA